MKIGICFESVTGNTKQVAEAIASALSKEEIVYKGGPDAAALEQCQLIFVGFWTDRGVCPPKTGELLKGLANKKVALFGTAGFGGDQSYFTGIAQHVAELLPESAVYLGAYVCQGKMPVSVKERYEALLEKDPGNVRVQGMLRNFDCARSHPDGADLKGAEDFAQKVLAEIR